MFRGNLIVNILIVGGSGLIGGHAALHLSLMGHRVTIGSRSAPPAESPMAMYPHLKLDYSSPDVKTSDLEEFDAIVFTAGKDPRDLEKDTDQDAFWNQMNIEATPRFFDIARQAGVKRVVNVGTFYPWVLPDLMDKNAYIRSRFVTDQNIHTLNSSSFSVVSVNPPFIIGYVRGLANRGSFVNIIRYARGLTPEYDVYAPAGGVHFMSTQSLSEAIEGALLRGEAGKSYLIGDQNYSYHDYFQLYFRAVGRDMEIPVLEKSHRLMGSFAGVGGTLYYDPDPEEAELLGYRRNDIIRAVGEVTQQYM
jgi:nucleoside-diphosphate-sugar epimerase